MIKLRHLFEQQQDDIHTIVVGGIDYAIANWMKGKWATWQNLSGVAFINHSDESEFNKLLKNNNIKVIIGFSLGAKLIWPKINISNFNLIGLIDPYTPKMRESLNDNVRMISNWKNWARCKCGTLDNLKEMEKIGVSTHVEKKHKPMPNHFFKEEMYPIRHYLDN